MGLTCDFYYLLSRTDRQVFTECLVWSGVGRALVSPPVPVFLQPVLWGFHPFLPLYSLSCLVLLLFFFPVAEVFGIKTDVFIYFRLLLLTCKRSFQTCKTILKVMTLSSSVFSAFYSNSTEKTWWNIWRWCLHGSLFLAQSGKKCKR